MASSAILNSQEALNVLQKAITKMYNIEGLSLMDESSKSKLGSKFDKVFDDLNEKIIL